MVLDTSLIKIFKLEARKSDSLLSVTEDSEAIDEYIYTQKQNEMNESNYAKISALSREIKEEVKDQGNVTYKDSIYTDKSKELKSINVVDSFSNKARNDSFDNMTNTDVGRNEHRVSKRAPSKRRVRKIKEILITSSKDFQLKGEFNPKLIHKPKKKSGKSFGQLYNATLKGEPSICRLIKFDRLTSYLTEDLYEEIQITNSI
jgi:hypothetical protein